VSNKYPKCPPNRLNRRQTPVGVDEYRLLTAAGAGSVMLAVMTSSITRTAVTCRPTRLFGYVGGVELPAAGTWQVPGGHTDNAFCLPRWRRRTARWRGRAGNDGVWRRVYWARG
jgi:hypothetical protein